jgi:ribonucleoside-diphosphate reductase alpha chain
MKNQIKKIRKRDGRIVDFKPKKITLAMQKAFVATETKIQKHKLKKLTDQIVETLNKKFAGKIPGVEDVQDIVEEVLIKDGYAEVAKAYILYRYRRSEIRETKKFFGVEDKLKLSVNAVKVLRERYLLKNKEGEVIETPEGMFHRVAKHVAKAELKYGGKRDAEKSEKEFYGVMTSLEFLPNSPTLMNAGTRVGQLSACFVIPIEDSMRSIMRAVTNMAIIHKSGGGTGFSFSKLRPAGDIVASTKGIASGPVSFMKIFDQTTEVIKQGGRRRGANMGILSVDHPDILEFITCKKKRGFLENFNLSVAASDKFMKAVEDNKNYDLINPRTNEPVRKIKARHVFDMITLSAWETGDPGLVFIDEINRRNQTPKIGEIGSTNPCGEQPLLPYESCNLGSINLSKVVKDRKIDWQKLRKLVQIGVRFLDNVIDVNKYPIAAIRKITLANRKIGLGVMGFAEMLIMLGISYNSNEASGIGQKIMRFISKEAVSESQRLAGKRGSFPNFKKSIWKKKYSKMRNATMTTIAPTGTISIIAGTTSGIEPLFAVVFVRNVLEGARLLEVNPLFEKAAKEQEFYNKKLINQIAKYGSIKDIREIPKNIRDLFVTAFDVSPKQHVMMQAAFQKHTDNAVSKTINLPQNSTVGDIRDAFILAYKVKCKGITVYRYGSKEQQVLNLSTELYKEAKEEFISAEPEYAGGCPGVVCTH